MVDLRYHPETRGNFALEGVMVRVGLIALLLSSTASATTVRGARSNKGRTAGLSSSVFTLGRARRASVIVSANRFSGAVGLEAGAWCR